MSAIEQHFAKILAPYIDDDGAVARELVEFVVPQYASLLSALEAARELREVVNHERDEVLALCWAIERLPASEEQTKMSVLASDIHTHLVAALEKFAAVKR